MNLLYCDEQDIKRQLSALRTPQQNDIVERMNKTIVEATRTMLLQGNVSKMFWREVVSTAVYTLNWVLVKRGNNKTPYELWYGKTPCVSYFKIFGTQCFIKRDNYIEKFDAKSDEGIFLGYSSKSKAYKCYNKRTKKTVESANVIVDDLFDKSEGTNISELEKDDN